MLHSCLYYYFGAYYKVIYWYDNNIDMDVVEMGGTSEDEDDIPFYMLNTYYDKYHWGL